MMTLKEKETKARVSKTIKGDSSGAIRAIECHKRLIAMVQLCSRA